MGALFFETQGKAKEYTAKKALLQLWEVMEEAGTGDDNSTEIEIIVRGRVEKKMVVSLENTTELLEILRLNSD
jgi:hypothetical protein